MYLDAVFLFLILLFAVAGYWMGFLRQIISLSALLSIVFLADPFAQSIKTSITHPWIVNCPQFVLWLGVALGILMLGYILDFLVDQFKIRPLLRPVDRWVGLGVGFVKGILVVLLMGTLMQMIPGQTVQKFADFEADYEKSYFVNAGSEIIQWDLLKHFQKIQKRVQEEPFKKVPATEPWLWDISEDRD